MMTVMDLSAAFDTTDHEIFLYILQNSFNIKGNALQWFDSYLRPRGFKVNINNSYSSEIDIAFSVPQGSCAGAPLFTAYCSSITTAVPACVDLNGFADDHSIRKDYNPNTAGEEEATNTLLSESLANVKKWMGSMRLKMNPDKTEYIQFGSRRQLAKVTQNDINCVGDIIDRSDVIRYLGADLDSTLSFEDHITRKCKCALANFFRIASFTKCLSRDTCQTLVLTLCLSHIDYCNAILVNLPECQIKRLQRVQNMRAKLILK